MSKVLIAQLFLILLVVAAYLGWAGAFQAQSALYGGALALANTFLLGKRMEGFDASTADGLIRGARMIYFGAVQRFALTLGLLIIGMGILRLSPAPIVITFAVAQLGWVGSLIQPSRSS
jgi:ATP synthase protein I